MGGLHHVRFSQCGLLPEGSDKVEPSSEVLESDLQGRTMVTIRMRRHGAKKSPFYRMVVIDSHSASDGRALEVVGHYDPKTQPETLRVERERIQYWVERGAQLSDTVRSLLERQPVADLPETEQAEVVETASS